MDRPSYLEEDYSSLDGLDDDVFHSDDFGLAGNAGYRLHVPPVGFALDPHLQEEPQEGQREARAEVQIARKLQCIADQFHRLHIQRVSTFQDLPCWLVVAGPCCCCCAKQWVSSSALLSVGCPSVQDLNFQLRMQAYGKGEYQVENS
ncbi:bcl-2-modifying factor isoform 4-T5 [Pluvialis apricaria]